jgi:hypothetical protein
MAANGRQCKFFIRLWLWTSLAAIGGGFLHKTHRKSGAMMTPKSYGYGEKKNALAVIGGHWLNLWS